MLEPRVTHGGSTPHRASIVLVGGHAFPVMLASAQSARSETPEARQDLMPTPGPRLSDTRRA